MSGPNGNYVDKICYCSNQFLDCSCMMYPAIYGVILHHRLQDTSYKNNDS